jgi:hypothetical protein
VNTSLSFLEANAILWFGTVHRCSGTAVVKEDPEVEAVEGL